MRLVSYRSDGKARVAAVRDGSYVDLQAADKSLPSTMIELLALGSDGLRRASEAVLKGSAILPAQVELLAPVPNPNKVICIGLNYSDHAAESGQPIPSESHRREVVWQPEGRGFVKLTVTDAKGRVDRVSIRLR